MMIDRDKLIIILLSGNRITRIRPTIIDGEFQSVTQDVLTDRINVEVSRGIVERIIRSGWI